MTSARGARSAATVVGVLAVLVLALAAWLAFITWWEQRGDDGSSYGVLAYAAAVVLGALGLLSLQLARAARTSGSTVLLVGAALPLLLVAWFVLAGAT